MKWSFTIGRLAGIAIRVHGTFFLLLAAIALLYWQQQNSLHAVVSGVLFVLALFACVVLHELGHALAARRYGIGTRDITLLPIGGVATLESTPTRPAQEIVVALAGPAVNLLIALLLWLLLAVSASGAGTVAFDADIETAVTGDSGFVERLLLLNLVLALFNLLPAFPMDGGRVLRAVLVFFMPRVRATRVAATVGQTLALLLGVLGLTGNPLLIFIALFVWIGAAGEAGYEQMRSSFSRIPLRRAMLTEFDTVNEFDSLLTAIDLTLRGSQKDFPVLRGARVVAVLTQEDLLRGLREQGEDASVRDYMIASVIEIDVGESLQRLFERMRESGSRLVAVTEDGALVGIVNYDNLTELIALDSATRRD